MTEKEANRLAVMKKVESDKLNQREASEELNLSLRQTQRIVKRYRMSGVEGLLSKKRGVPSNRKISNKKRQRVLKLIKKHYGDFGPTLAMEKLREEHGIEISREWLRCVLAEEGLWRVKKRRQTRAYSRRERRGHVGELVQMDGSYHKWFEERGEKSCLIHIVDDATREILAAMFCPHESIESYFELIEIYLKQHGKPESIYTDKHSVFRVNKAEVLGGRKPTQFHRALKELKIELICATSPQAKGRIERKNRVLQDRLVKEMRLKGISTPEEANKYLKTYIKKHNKQFGVEPKYPKNVHKPVTENLDLILATKSDRKLSKELSIQYKNKLYQIETNTPNRMRYKKVKITERKGAPVRIELDGKELKYTIFEEYRRNYPRELGCKELHALGSKRNYQKTA